MYRGTVRAIEGEEEGRHKGRGWRKERGDREGMLSFW